SGTAGVHVRSDAHEGRPRGLSVPGLLAAAPESLADRTLSRPGAARDPRADHDRGRSVVPVALVDVAAGEEWNAHRREIAWRDHAQSRLDRALPVVNRPPFGNEADNQRAGTERRLRGERGGRHAPPRAQIV